MSRGQGYVLVVGVSPDNWEPGSVAQTFTQDKWEVRVVESTAYGQVVLRPMGRREYLRWRLTSPVCDLATRARRKMLTAWDAIRGDDDDDA